MPRTCDWKDLNEGDIFEVPNPTSSWQYDLGIYGSGKGVLYQIHNLTICAYPHGSAICHHYRHPSFGNYGALKINQAVVVYTDGDIPVEARFRTLYSRVNGYTGADPEIFVVRGKEKKSLLPAFQFLPTQDSAKKQNPQWAYGFGTFHPAVPAMAYRDGFAAEYFVNPVGCHGYVIDFLRIGLQKIRDAARQFDRTAELTTQNAFTIPAITMDNATDADVALGCMPSENAYDDAPVLPTDGRDFRMRFAGGHVHLGIASLSKQKAVKIVKACDVVAAIPGVAIFASVDKPIRRHFYGRAGEYRQPKHGLEYRTLSNAWLSAPEIAHLMLNLVRSGAKVGYNNYLKYFPIAEEEAQNIINFCDVKSARKFVLANLKAYTSLLEADGITAKEQGELAFKRVIEGGIEDIYEDYTDIQRNWKLDEPWKNHSNDLANSWSTKCMRLRKA